MVDTVGDLRGARGLEEQRKAQQIALLPEDVDVAEAALEQPERRGPGRPPGAVNRATRAMRDYILNRFTDPAVGLAVTGLRSNLIDSAYAAIALAGVLGCKPIEAMELMRKCSAELMPYVHSKQPLAVAIAGKIAQLHIGLGQGGERVSGGQLAELLDEFMRGPPPEDEDLVLLENDDGSST